MCEIELEDYYYKQIQYKIYGLIMLNLTLLGGKRDLIFRKCITALI